MFYTDDYKLVRIHQVKRMSELPEPLARANLRGLFDPPEEQATEKLEIPPENPVPLFYYRVSVPIVDELARQINVARGTIGMDGALIGSFAWQADFKTQQIEAVQTLLREWVTQHLPIAVRVERVEALVEGTQRYLAAFSLEPAERIQNAQAALQNALQAVITPLPFADQLPFVPRLPIADHVNAAHFPRLIHMLQMNFDPTEWQIQAVELLYTPDTRWEVLDTFRAS